MIAEVISLMIILTCSVVCGVLGRFIARGEGDSLIAGYNTASKEEREQYDIVRLRRFTSAMLYAMALLMPLFSLTALLPERYAMVAILVLVVVMCVGVVVAVIWGNKWTRKK